MQKFWRFLSKALKIVGAVCYTGLFCGYLFLIFHWRSVRPYSPRPDLGWTVRLPWCLGAYGTAHEAHLLNAIFDWLTVPFMMCAAGIAIDYYKFGILPFGNRQRIQK
jgi:hypothetical protein